jgi:competence protein ComEC
VAAPAFVVVAVHVAGLVQLGRGERSRGLGLLAASHLGLLLGPTPVGGDGRLHLEVLDVGQGDSLLLRSPSGRCLLIDAGGSYDPHYDVGERRVAPALWSFGVHRLDALVLTHAHPDHVGGAPFILHAFEVNEVWEGPAAPRDPAWRRLDETLVARAVARRGLRRGQGASWDGVRLDVLGPDPTGPALRVRNEDSIVLAATLGGITLLLPGDVQGDAEDRLDAPPCFVVKVPHHGSRSSSHPRLLRRTAPRVALVSVGERNPFGHPSDEVLGRYARGGCLLLRTDRDGPISVSTDGSRVWVRPSREAVERRIR